LHQFGAEPSAEVSEDDDSFTVRVRIQGVEQSEPQLFVVADTIAIHGSQRTFALVIVHCGSMERWLLLPGAIDASRVSTEVIDDVLSVTLPKSAPGV
jgi:HSP20 family molecular chaperone IbpA